MKNRLVHFLVLCLVLATVFTFTKVRPADASCVIINVQSPWGYTPFIRDAGHLYRIDSGGTTSYLPVFPSNYPDALLAYNTPGLNFTLTDTSSDCGTTFFNPGDGRIDARPGCRVVVYCNMSGAFPNIDVWGVTNDSQGHRLFIFPLTDPAQGRQQGHTEESRADGQRLCQD